MNIYPDTILDIAFLTVSVSLLTLYYRPDLRTEAFIVMGTFSGAVVSDMIKKEARK